MEKIQETTQDTRHLRRLRAHSDDKPRQVPEYYKTAGTVLLVCAETLSSIIEALVSDR